MSSDNALRDYVQTGTVEDLKNTLVGMEQHFMSVRDWVEENTRRTEESVTLLNLLSSSAEYLRVTVASIEGHISVLALAVRSIYELNLRTRSIASSTENMKLWHSEAVTDKFQMLEGLLQLNTIHSMDAQRKVLREEIDRLKELRDKYNLPGVKNPAGAARIAANVGQSDEHKGLFKLFSKLVHPSSYLVNDYKNAASEEVRGILQIHAQLYAWDTFSRVCDSLSVPDKIRDMPVTNRGSDA